MVLQTGKALFTSREVSEIIGLSRRQIQHWSQTSLIRPSQRTTGGHSRYTFQDLIAFKTAKNLLQKGISLQRIRQTISKLQDLLPTIQRPLAELRLVTTGDVVLVFHEGMAFEAVSGQEWILQAADVVEAVDLWQQQSGERREGSKLRRIQSADFIRNAT